MIELQQNSNRKNRKRQVFVIAVEASLAFWIVHKYIICALDYEAWNLNRVFNIYFTLSVLFDRALAVVQARRRLSSPWKDAQNRQKFTPRRVTPRPVLLCTACLPSCPTWSR